MPFTVPSPSTEATLQVGDRILVDRVTPRLRGVRRGDVVVDGSTAFAAPGRDLVERVIGIGGDRATCSDDRGRVRVNAPALDERRYLYRGDSASERSFDVEVPADRLWVMGDHRSDSRDSRAHIGTPGGSTVPDDDVVGRVIGVIRAWARAGGVS